ncbi:hypothetical protein D9M69_709310 [compost metagenome]
MLQSLKSPDRFAKLHTGGEVVARQLQGAAGDPQQLGRLRDARKVVGMVQSSQRVVALCEQLRLGIVQAQCGDGAAINTSVARQ